MNVNKTFGKVFRSQDGESLGLIRNTNGPFPAEIKNENIFAEDECGNYFLERTGAVLFWDHETSETIKLSNSMDEFVAGCVVPEGVELEPENVISAWIDPEFAKQHGIEK